MLNRLRGYLEIKRQIITQNDTSVIVWHLESQLLWLTSSLVKSLEPLAASKIQTLPLSTLKDATLGIEAEFYLWRLLNTAPTKEPLLSALGGFPYGLKQAIEDDLAAFRTAGIKPLFVFNGLKVARTEKPFLQADHGPTNRLKAWDMYDRGLPTQAVEAFGDASKWGGLWGFGAVSLTNVG